MYWRSETADLWQGFWAQVQAALPGLPDLPPPDRITGALTTHWLRPDLALSMTCGLPLRSELRGRVTYVGTLGFGLRCAPGHYFSRIITRFPPHQSRPERVILAVNSFDSHWGWAVTQQAAPFSAPLRVKCYVETGSHAASLAAVARGQADVAYIDAITWRVLKRCDPLAQQVHLAGQSAAAPGLPLICAKGRDPAPLRAALRDAVLQFQPRDPDAMGGPLGWHVLPLDSYLSQPMPAPPRQPVTHLAPRQQA